MIPAPIVPRHAVARRFRRREADQHRAGRGRPGQDADRDLGDHAEQPFRSGDDAEQVVARRIQVPAADAHHLAVHQHQLDAEQVVGGEPVFEAMDAARVLGDVAADRARDLARRVGRVVEPRRLDRLADGEVGHARLDRRAAVGVVDVENPVELAEAEQDSVGERQRAARERGAGAARHHLDPVLAAVFEDRRDLRHRLRQDGDHRRLAIGGETVGFVGPERVAVVDRPVARDDPGEGARDLGPTRDNVRIGLGHLHRAIPVPARPARRNEGIGAPRPVSPGAP